jgi:SAM-dependent methyltransferase
MLTTDPWLEPWLRLVAERAGANPLLELGCGPGLDTAALQAAGHRIVAIDLSAESIAKARASVPSAEFHCQDLRAPFPASAAGANVVVASLSLHYFSGNETLALVERIFDLLSPAGLLLCRLNSTNDHHYGASGHPQIEPNYYLVDGEPKRFFDQADVQALFATGWRLLQLEERIVHRYAKPKSVWEVVLEKAGD